MKGQRMNFEVGQNVIVSHQKRQHIPPVTMPGTVIKLGRIYATGSIGHSEIQLEIDALRRIEAILENEIQ